MTNKECFDYFLNPVVLPRESVIKIFDYSDTKVKLNHNKYVDVLCFEISRSINCPLKCLRFNLLKDSVTFYFGCTINEKKKYRLTVDSKDIMNTLDLIAEFSSNDPETCDHGDLMNFRQLRGATRQELKGKLINEMPKKVKSYFSTAVVFQRRTTVFDLKHYKCF